MKTDRNMKDKVWMNTQEIDAKDKQCKRYLRDII